MPHPASRRLAWRADLPVAVGPLESAVALGIGVLAGVFGGLSGLGGTAVMVPLLTSRLGFTQHQAHATSLVGVLAVGFSAAARYAWGQHVHWGLAAGISVAAVLSAQLGVRAARSLSGPGLREAFGWFMFVLASWLWARSAIFSLPPRPLWAYAWTLGPLIGLGSGFLAGFFGIGGGIVIIPALVMLGFPQHTAQGTSLAAIFPSGVAGVAGHHRLGNVRWAYAPPLAVGSVVGGYLGAALAHRLDETTLRLVMALAVAAVGTVSSGLWRRLGRRVGRRAA